MISTHLRNLLSMGGKTETTTAGIIKYEENTRVFSRGMNPTTPLQSRWLDGIFHRSQALNVNTEAGINNYTDVQNAGNPPNPSSEDLQPRTGSGLA